jgi:hypothetical protein
MKRPSPSLLFLSLPFLGLMTTGCQRSMNGSMASGPFAPAGTTAPAGGSQLFPMGPITGATRVPPPSTGSSSASNGYIGTPSASNFAAPNTMQASLNSGSPTAGPAPVDSVAVQGNSLRNSLGGMPVIDLTAQLSPEQPPAPVYGSSSFGGTAPQTSAQGYDSFASSAPVGSGVYPAPYASETSVRTAQPSELLRPIDQPYAAVPVPRYRGIEPTAVAPNAYAAAPTVSPAGGFPSTDAWQSVASQPVPAANYSTGANVGVTRSGPSTEPVRQATNAPAAQVASPSLPWRSPTTAR